MILENIYIPGNGVCDLTIKEGDIYSILESITAPPPLHASNNLQMDGCIAFPGLINSHDHLEFNVFPRLGHTQYADYIEWGNDIHVQDKKVIESVLKIPTSLRAAWGMYKNLFNGVTTVIQHGTKLHLQNPVIHIHEDHSSLHSVHLDKTWKRKLLNPAKNKKTFVIHIGEGTSQRAKKEIDTFIHWNILRKKIIGIHGVAMSPSEAVHFKALVWCPDSNFFLLGKTAAIDQLKNKTNILFGTDSTVSANWNIWEQLRQARHTALLTNEELINAISTNPSKAWNLQQSGKLAKGYKADLIIAKNSQNIEWYDTFFSLNPETILMVIVHGKIRLFDDSFKQELDKKGFDFSKFCPLYINGTLKHVVGNVTDLIKKMKQYYPGIILPVCI